MTTYDILLIEDDPAVGSSLSDALKEEGYRVTWCKTGTGGVEHVRSFQTHLIILDIRLPDGSGFDVCKEMRRLGLSQPILMLTARREEMDKVLGLELGADDYVTKPFHLRELLSRLRAMLRRAYGEFSVHHSDILYINDIVIDQSRAQVKRGEKLLNLTPTEFRILLYLARHPGQAVTRAQIIDAVWEHQVDIETERAVNVHIRRLREKIEIDPAHPRLILTVPGVGYRLVEQTATGRQLPQSQPD